MRVLRHGEKFMHCPHCLAELLFDLRDVHHGAIGYYVTCPNCTQNVVGLFLSVHEKHTVDERIRHDPDESW